MNYSLYQMGWILVTYSFLGWCAEVAFAAIRRGIFVNRGFLNGPVCPIYGFGVLIVVLLLEPFKEHLLLLFLGSVVLTTVLEFVTGYLMERFFHDKWWDYSNNAFNIKGYVCLEASISWGLACILIVDVVHPLIMKFINVIPVSFGKWMLLVLMIIFALDGIMTLMEILKMPKRFITIKELEKAITAVSDSVGENIYETVEWGKEKSAAFDQRHPDFAEKKHEYTQSIQDKRKELGERSREKELANREAAAQRKAELEQRLAELKSKSHIERRIVKAYPQLLKGKNNGENFKKIKEYYDGLRKEKKESRKAQKEAKAQEKAGSETQN